MKKMVKTLICTCVGLLSIQVFNFAIQHHLENLAFVSICVATGNFIYLVFQTRVIGLKMSAWLNQKSRMESSY